MSLAVASPSLASLTDWRMSPSVRLAASLERSASERTSSATTAKPRPASPARAASTAALRARRLVWKAMSLMSRMICEVPSAAPRIRAMEPWSASAAWAPPEAAPPAAWAMVLARSEFSRAARVMEVMVEMAAVVCWSAAACSVAPLATAWLEVAICWEAPETWLAASATWATASWRAVAVAFTESLMRARSPW